MSEPKHEESIAFWRRFASWYDRFLERALPEFSTIVERIGDDVAPCESALDLATGTGTIALALARKVQRVDAVDFAPEMIDIARRKASDQNLTNITFSIQNICSLEFPDNHFDAVVCSNVLHLLAEPAKALAEAQRVLKPRGMLVAPTFCHGETPLAMVLSSTMRLAGFKAYSRWTLDSYRRFVESCRFEVVRDDAVPGAIPLCYLMGRRLS